MPGKLEVVPLVPRCTGRSDARGLFVPLGLTTGKVADVCGMAGTRIERIVVEQIGISGDMALRLGRVSVTGPELWMDLQSRYEI